MATKSDFAQKLLHDLRLRKEQMAATQNNNSMVSKGSYGNHGQTYKGSRQIKALESVGSRSGKSFGGTRSETGSYYVSGDSSNQIVAYGKGTSSAQIGDLSAALAFAFGNGGKFGRMDGSGNIQMLNFLQHIGRRSMDKGMIVTRSSFGKISTNGHCPTFSHIHINEVSKGVQKLNQILRACSNGVNFDRYSIEVGRELLKGAMDLEESLRVLADLQEASDYMNSTQRKSKIKLLEDDEEDDENESAKLTEMKRLDRPRFSFDKPSRTTTSTKETAKNGIKQQFMALTYGEETPRLQAKQLQSSSNFGSHTRSGSYLPDYGTLSTYFEPKSPSISSHSKPEKGRISNVIAKLMGLDELPSKGDSKTTEKEMSSKRKESTVSKKHGASDDSIPQQTENGPHSSSQKRMASSQITPSRDTAFVQKAERIQAIPNGSSKVALSEENSLQQDIEIAARKDAGSVSKIATIIMDNQQSRVNQHNEVAGYRKVLHEKRKEENNKIDEENIVTKKGESKDLFMNNEKMPKAPERQKVSEENALEDTFIKRHAAQTEKKNAGNLLQSKQQKQQHGHEHQQLKVTKKFDNLQEKRKQDVVKQKLQAREAKGNQNELTVLPKTKDSAKGSTKKQLYANLAPGSKKKPMKHIEVKPKGPPNSRNVARATHETSMHVPHQRKKINNKKINESQIDKKIDTVANRRNGTLDHSAGPLNSHSPVRPEMKHQKDEKASINRVAKQESEPEHKGTEAGITEFKETEGSSYPANGVAQLKNVAEGVTFNNSDENECQGLEVPKSLTSSDSPSNIAHEEHEVPDDEQACISTEDLQFESFKVVSTPDRGGHEGSPETFKQTHDEHKKIPSSGSAELLTEAEKQLKEILIKGQLFLNTAEALFKLNIPVSILHGSDHNNQGVDNKLTLDCAYELLKEKGRRQELAIYPCKEKSLIGYVKIKSFDDLIKQLSKDFDNLKFSGGKTDEECDTADYLHKMLEKDIQNIKPDMNSMWDFSWNEKTFGFLEKDEIVKDVEKQMLNGLLDEITRDLLHIPVSA